MFNRIKHVMDLNRKIEITNSRTDHMNKRWQDLWRKVQPDDFVFTCVWNTYAGWQIPKVNLFSNLKMAETMIDNTDKMNLISWLHYIDLKATFNID